MKRLYNTLLKKQKNTGEKTPVHAYLHSAQLIRIILFNLCVSFFFVISFSISAEELLPKEKVFNLVAAVYPPYNYQEEEIKGLNIEVIKKCVFSIWLSC